MGCDYDYPLPTEAEKSRAKAKRDEAARIKALGFTEVYFKGPYSQYDQELHSCDWCAAVVIDPDKHRTRCYR